MKTILFVSISIVALRADTVLLAGTDHGVYRSVDGGYSWTAALSDVNCTVLQYRKKDGSVLYAATESGVFRSEDYGQTWTFRNAIALTGMAVDAGDENLLYGIVRYRELWTSTDGGSNWTKLQDRSRAVYTDDFEAGRVYVTSAYYHDVDRMSTDWGQSWRPLSFRLSAIQADPVSPGVVWAFSGFDDFFRSDDGGLSWYVESSLNGRLREFEDGWWGDRLLDEMSPIAIEPTGQGDMYACLGDWFWGGGDGEQVSWSLAVRQNGVWKLFKSPAGSGYACNAIVRQNSPEGCFFVATEKGLYRKPVSQDLESAWELTRDLAKTSVNALVQITKADEQNAPTQTTSGRRSQSRF